jgi:hypothetical protein
VPPRMPSTTIETNEEHQITMLEKLVFGKDKNI